eukprot:852089-Amphidinium_carterae.1
MPPGAGRGAPLQPGGEIAEQGKNGRRDHRVRSGKQQAGSVGALTQGRRNPSLLAWATPCQRYASCAMGFQATPKGL